MHATINARLEKMIERRDKCHGTGHNHKPKGGTVLNIPPPFG
jgi:hypothetical protein